MIVVGIRRRGEGGSAYTRSRRKRLLHQIGKSLTFRRMATWGDIVGAVDAFMAAPKRIVGSEFAPQWGPGFTPHERVVKYPLEIAGEQHGAQLLVVAFPHQRDLKFRLGILFPAMVSRLDYTDETHLNSLDGARSGVVPPIVSGPHYHSWDLNRRFFRGVTKPPKLHDAIPYSGAGRTFDGVLRWFCAQTTIDSLPPGHSIVLPPADRLL